MTLPFLISNADSISFSTSEQIQDRHSDGNAVVDLVEDQRKWSVGDIRIDLNTTVNRPGMKNHNVFLRQFEATPVEPVMDRVLTQAREETARLPFELDAKHHHDICISERVSDVAGEAD